MSKIRKHHWSTEEVEDMTTEEIIEKLRSFGVDFDKEQFLKQIENHFSAENLTKECYDNNTAVHFDEDFIWMAVMVLWKRLAPERINVEMIDDEMQEGYGLLEKKETKKAVDLWLKTWDGINKLLPKNIQSVYEADNVFLMMQSIHNWSQDLVMELYNHALNDYNYWEKGIRLCEEFCNRFKDDYFQMAFTKEKAVFLYHLGKKKEAIEIFEKLLKEYPKEPNVYYGYANTVKSETERVYKLAIERGVKDKGIAENLNLCCKEKEKKRESRSETTTKNGKEISSLIEELKQYDNKEGYNLSYDEVKEKLENTAARLIECSEECVECLHPFLEHEETWSCAFALEILRQIKNEKSILPLINFIKKNEDGDYYKCYEEVMYALSAIGEPAIEPLIKEIRTNFENKKYFVYLVGGLTGIKHNEVYSFMVEILKDYIDNIEKYDDWFKIEDFIYNFEVQKKKEAIPILKKVLAMEHLSEYERHEIKSTIEIIEDPEKFDKEFKDMAKGFEKYAKLKKEDINEKELLEQAVDFEAKKDYDSALECVTKIIAVYPKSYHALFLGARINRKLGEPNMLVFGEAMEQARKQKASKEVLELMEEERKKAIELFKEMESTADEELELNFKCLDCGRRQNLKPGLIWGIECGRKYSFENEMMCRHCFSHNIELTRDGEMRLTGQKIRLMTGQSTGIIDVSKEVMVENKKMKFNKSYPYLLNRIKQNPLNGELYLRAGNSARKINKYEEAIKHYKKAVQLNPRLIAVYVNLIEIYRHRSNYYKIKEAENDVLLYLKKIKALYESQDYDSVTMKNYKDIIHFIREKEAEFGLSANHTKMIKEKDVEKTLKQFSTLDISSVSSRIKESINDSKEEAQKLLRENKGITVLESYRVFDKKTEESKRLQVASVMPVDMSKLCICGSGKYLKECCINHVIKKKPFVINTDYATYSLFDPINEKIKIKVDFSGLAEGFKDDPRFYYENEAKNNTFFTYHGDSFFTVKGMGIVVFGTVEIKKEFNKSIMELEALCKERFDSLYRAVREHLEE